MRAPGARIVARPKKGLTSFHHEHRVRTTVRFGLKRCPRLPRPYGSRHLTPSDRIGRGLNSSHPVDFAGSARIEISDQREAQ